VEDRFMVRIDGEVVIDRPVEVVFDFVADGRNEPAYNPALSGVDNSAGAGRGGHPVSGRVEGAGPVGGDGDRAHRVRAARAPVLAHPDGRDGRRGDADLRAGRDGHPDALGLGPAPARGPESGGPLIARIGRRQEEEIWAGLKAHLEAGESP